MKWQFWRRNAQPVEKFNSNNRVELTPENFPAKELFQKSSINWRKLFAMSSGLFIVNAYSFYHTIFDFHPSHNHHSSISNHHYVTHFPSTSIMNIIFIVVISYYIIHSKKSIQRVHYSLQKYVDDYGIISVPSLLDLLRIHVAEGKNDFLPDTLLYNLADLIPLTDEDEVKSISREMYELICMLLDPDGIDRNKYKRFQPIRLKLASIILTPSLVDLLGRIGDENGLKVLQNRSSYIESEILKHNIQISIGRIQSRIHSGYTIPIEQRQQITYFHNTHHNQSHKTAYRFITPLVYIIYGIFPVIVYYVLHCINLIAVSFPNISFLGTLIFLPTYFLSLIPILSLTTTPSTPFIKSLGDNRAVQYDPETIGKFLSIDSYSNSIYTKALILSSLLQNTNLSQLEPLNRMQLNNYYKLLLPPPALNSQLNFYNQCPLPDVGVIPIMLRGLVFLGDSSSVKIIEKFYKTTENEDYKLAAMDCLEALNARLTQKPELLLRASSMPKDTQLLNVVNAPDETQELLKPVSSEERIELTKSESSVEDEVNRQQL